MDKGTVRADRVYRRRILAFNITLALFSASVLQWGLPRAREFLKQADPETAKRAVMPALVIVFLSIVPMGYSLIRFGCSIIASERFPPPGTRVIVDTPVMRGRRAKFRGHVPVALALLLITCSLSGALYTPYMPDHLVSRMAEARKTSEPAGTIVSSRQP
jgi:hypothetical protein